MKIKILLFLVVIIAAVLRFYKLGEVPPSISWDEAAVGYNAYTIANFGKDEWGRSFPLMFESFGEFKHPVYVYLTVPFVKIFGLNDFSTRAATALMGVLNVILLYFLARRLFSNNTVGLLTAAVFSVSPYAINFARFNHQAQFALFFFMLGIWSFLKGLKEKPYFLIISSLGFMLSLFSYQPSIILVPAMIALLVFLYYGELSDRKLKKSLLLASLVIVLAVILILQNPNLTGMGRLKQTSITDDVIKQTTLYQQTGNSLLGMAEITFNRFLIYFSPQYLFISGDRNPKFSTQSLGMFYKIDSIFLVIGLVALVMRRSKITIILLVWSILALLPASATGGAGEIPHSGRAMFTMGSWHLIIGLGIYTVHQFLSKKLFKIGFYVIFFAILTIEVRGYLIYYYNDYGKKNAIDWQYGMKQIVEYVQDRNGYSLVYMTDIRFEPYIFFLYYLKTSLPQFLDTAVYNTDKEKRKYNLITAFDKYHFGDWDPIESILNPGVLYVVTPSQYDGMRNRDSFDVKKKILYPDGGDAYYLVSYP